MVPNGTATDESDSSAVGDVVVASRHADRVSLAGRPDSLHLPLVPDGLCHGVRLGADRTLCGDRLDELTLFPGLSYASAVFLLRCSECSALVVATR